MALNEDEKNAVRYYMGYAQINTAAAISLGVPDKTQLNFIVEFNMRFLNPIAEPRVRRSIQELECIEEELSRTRRGVEVKSVTGSVQFQHQEAFDILKEQYVDWVGTLADTLGAPVNQFSNRLARMGYGTGLGPGVMEPG